jgi:hypothetical protein
MGYLRPSDARPLGGWRPAHLLGCSAAWHRLSCLLSCLRRGTTRPRLCTLAACTSQVLVCLLGAPPTGGTHCESNAPPGPIDASSFWPLIRTHSSTSSAHMSSILYIHSHVHLRLVSVVCGAWWNGLGPFTTPLLAVPTALYQLVGRCSSAITSTSVSEVALR